MINKLNHKFIINVFCFVSLLLSCSHKTQTIKHQNNIQKLFFEKGKIHRLEYPDYYLGYGLGNKKNENDAIEIAKMEAMGELAHSIKEEIFVKRERFIKIIQNNEARKVLKDYTNKIIAGTDLEFPDTVIYECIFKEKKTDSIIVGYNVRISRNEYAKYLEKNILDLVKIIDDFIELLKQK